MLILSKPYYSTVTTNQMSNIAHPQTKNKKRIHHIDCILSKKYFSPQNPYFTRNQLIKQIINTLQYITPMIACLVDYPIILRSITKTKKIKHFQTSQTLPQYTHKKKPKIVITFNQTPFYICTLCCNKYNNNNNNNNNINSRNNNKHNW